MFHYFSTIYFWAFLFCVVSNKQKIPYMLLIFGLFFLLLLYFLFTYDLAQPMYHAFSITNFGLIVLCVIYYYQLFNNIPTLNLLKEPSFWIITGIFFGMSINVPLSAIISYLDKRISVSTFMIFGNIFIISYGIMHLFFIKAIICAVKMNKA